MATELTDAEFESSIIESGEAYLVDFWAPWCGPCKMIAPVVDELATEYDGKLKVGKVNVDDFQELAMRFGVASIPTLLLFKNGEVKERITGAVPKKTIQDAISKHL